MSHSSTPSENDQHNLDGSATRAPKDKACPFCSQKFTSSSLGRHLDLYIRPKNAKLADGVHDVDRIRRMRNGITRRQPRSNLKAKRDSDVAAETPTPASAPATTTRWESKVHEEGGERSARLTEWTSRTERDEGLASPAAWSESIPRPPNEKLKVLLNTVNWQGTGVINNIPTQDAERPSGYASSVPPLSRAESSVHRDRPDSEHLALSAEESEVGRAAQLALREVLDSIEAARYAKHQRHRE